MNVQEKFSLAVNLFGEAAHLDLCSGAGEHGIRISACLPDEAEDISQGLIKNRIYGKLARSGNVAIFWLDN